MKIDKIENMPGGWFIGNFFPSVIQTEEFEICVKRYKAGQIESLHFQLVATEVTVVISGKIRMGGKTFGPNDIILLEPGEVCDFEAKTDTVLVAVKTPSLPEDKVVV